MLASASWNEAQQNWRNQARAFRLTTPALARLPQQACRINLTRPVALMSHSALSVPRGRSDPSDMHRPRSLYDAVLGRFSEISSLDWPDPTLISQLTSRCVAISSTIYLLIDSSSTRSEFQFKSCVRSTLRGNIYSHIAGPLSRVPTASRCMYVCPSALCADYLTAHGSPNPLEISSYSFNYELLLSATPGIVRAESKLCEDAEVSLSIATGRQRCTRV